MKQKKQAIANALRYFPQKWHTELAEEFSQELLDYGHIYMHRFRPNYEMFARPIKDYSSIETIIGLKNFKNKINFKKTGSLEAQISAISDDIAYNNHDIQDGIKAKLFKLDDLLQIDFFKLELTLPVFRARKFYS